MPSRIITFFIVCGILLLSPLILREEIYAKEITPLQDLQHLIQNAKPGETLHIPPGDYKGPILIDKPLQLEAAIGNVHIFNDSNEPAIQLKADHTRMNGIEIVDSIHKDESAAIVILGDYNTLDHLTVQTKSTGIQLRNANHNTIQNTSIAWLEEREDRPAKVSEKGNGIDLWESHQNKILGNQLSNLHDGIYMEKSNLNQIDRNQIVHSRYGIHCMYTDDIIVENNDGSYNVTGMMIMGAKNSRITGNTFYKQSENVNSQGLLLYDVQSSLIERNRLEGNRVGMYVEQSQNNELIHNVISQNFVGLQLKNTQKNTSKGNEFYANVIQAEAVDSQGNKLEGNYWDGFRGIDLTDTGHSSITYGINPFFQKLTEEVPAYQLFFQSPGLPFLESMFTTKQESWTKDLSPLMKPALVSGESLQSQSYITLWFGLVLMILPIITIYYLGVKRV
ncbi:MAG TPA: NosD domain-containing protein [Bacillota bacterium]|nr:NosD domain-containing protein [Bacillota bacterium]